MSPGDRVKQKASGKQGKILRIDGGRAIVDTADGEKAWAITSLKLVSRSIAPRGGASVNDTMRAAARLIDEGATRQEVMELYDIERPVLQAWLDAVKTAERDAQNLERVRRTG